MAKDDARASVAAASVPFVGNRMTTREEALALGPEQSHRIIAVLEEAAEKLGFLGSIMPDVLQHRDELSKFVGDEISRIIQVCRLGGASCVGPGKCGGKTDDRWKILARVHTYVRKGN